MKRERKEQSLEEVQRKNRRIVAIGILVISLAWPLLAAIKQFVPGAIDSWKEVAFAPLPVLAIQFLGLIVIEGSYRVHLWIHRGEAQEQQPKPEKQTEPLP